MTDEPTAQSGTGRTGGLTGGAQTLLVGFPPSYAVAELTVGDARGCNQIVEPAPTETEPWHAFLKGPKTNPNRRCLVARSKYATGQYFTSPD